MHSRWRGSALARATSSLLTVKLVDTLAGADFQPAASLAVLLLGEREIVSGLGEVEARLGQLGRGLRPYLLFLHTDLTAQYLLNFQVRLVIQLGHVLVPINSKDQVPQLLQQLQQAEAARHPVLPRAPPPPSPVQTHTSILRAACALPGLGEVRARRLLETVGSLQGAARAEQSELSTALGPSLARSTHDFFRKRSTL